MAGSSADQFDEPEKKRPKMSDSSAVQLSETEGNRPLLLGLEEMLFTCGPLGQEVVEIGAEYAHERYILMYKILRKAILPKTCYFEPFGGLDAGVIFLNTEHCFHEDYFRRLLRKDVRIKLGASFNNISDQVVENIVNSSLRNLHVFSSESYEDFSRCLNKIKLLLSQDKKIALLMINNLWAYYWETRHIWGNFPSVSTYVDALRSNYLGLINSYLKEFNIGLIFCTPSNFVYAENKRIPSRTLNLKDVNQYVEFKRRGNVTFVELNTFWGSKSVQYLLRDNQIVWN